MTDVQNFHLTPNYEPWKCGVTAWIRLTDLWIERFWTFSFFFLFSVKSVFTLQRLCIYLSLQMFTELDCLCRDSEFCECIIYKLRLKLNMTQTSEPRKWLHIMLTLVPWGNDCVRCTNFAWHQTNDTIMDRPQGQIATIGHYLIGRFCWWKPKVNATDGRLCFSS